MKEPEWDNIGIIDQAQSLAGNGCLGQHLEHFVTQAALRDMPHSPSILLETCPQKAANRPGFGFLQRFRPADIAARPLL